MSVWRPTSRVGLLVAFLMVPAVVGAIVQLSAASRPRGRTAAPTSCWSPRTISARTPCSTCRSSAIRSGPKVRRPRTRTSLIPCVARVVRRYFTGLYPHSTGVYSNDPNGLDGGFPAFDDRSTIATWLHGAGYHTGLFGKYLNGYETEYVPPGWDRWFAMHESSAYYQYETTSDGDIVDYGTDRQDYGTTVFAKEATTFIRDTPSGTPLFAYISVAAPHSPAIAAPRDLETFESLRPWRPPSYNEKDLSDKPRYMRQHRWLDGEHRQEIDAYRLAQIRSLQAVDRLVGETIDVLKSTGRLSNTMIVFTSDNGVLWGEHRWNHKDVPYEESISVPMVVRYDPLTASARRDSNLVLNVDLAPTFADAAGVGTPATEGTSFLPLLLDPAASWRDGFLIEHMAARGSGVPSYCGYHTSRYVLVRYDKNESELYDLTEDPWQLENRDDDPALTQVRSSLNDGLLAACRPPPPALTLH